MKCECDYCVYNRDSTCIIDEIQINSLGMCEEYLIVSLPKVGLRLLKEKRLKELEESP